MGCIITAARAVGNACQRLWNRIRNCMQRAWNAIRNCFGTCMYRCARYCGGCLAARATEDAMQRVQRHFQNPTVIRSTMAATTAVVMLSGLISPFGVAAVAAATYAVASALQNNNNDQGEAPEQIRLLAVGGDGDGDGGADEGEELGGREAGRRGEGERGNDVMIRRRQNNRNDVAGADGEIGDADDAGDDAGDGLDVNQEYENHMNWQAVVITMWGLIFYMIGRQLINPHE